ncbi:MAG TPA: alpha-glucan family phosphorylase [Ktedonobacterales bacterium]|nr:alpha-glucan family phosphorylase [Ktedonobacterales bacterium]
MKVLGRMAVFPAIPPRIGRLHELAYNLWWTWNTEAQALYAWIDGELWAKTEHNAVRVLLEAAPERLTALAGDAEFLRAYDRVLAAFDAYMRPESTWFSRTYPGDTGKTIAYFSAEFGLHESLPIYSGGLGILSGDHCKEASDLGLPFVGVGFLYPQGYFRQRITRDGQQEALYEKLHFSDVAATPATAPDGGEVIISVELPGRKVFAKVWRIQVGRIPLFLMDTDVEPNGPTDRTLSARLYGGDHEMRIAQEIVLGIGGVRALRALKIDALVWHMNEGHSAFLNLERCRELVNGLGVPFAVAREIAAANSIFTTHTPVAAGNDVFNDDLIDRYFADFWPNLGLDREQFQNIARQELSWGSGFSMTILALRLSAQHNGVSRLHGDVSRRMWHFLWPDIEVDEVPIGSITNGVHTATWLAPRLAELYRRYLGAGWYDALDDPVLWAKVEDIPAGELWEAHRELKGDLVEYARQRIARQRTRTGEAAGTIAAAGALLDPEALALGFARRFATYKRATLLFRDPARLAKLLSDPERPVQIVFAGKAHPNDQPGQDFIRQVYQYSLQPEFAGRVVFLEDYDIDMARHLVAGCDVWLNTPIRPHEASGTSGQKASLNGLPNCSIMDGWWEEGYNGRNGWAIGEHRDYADDDTRDAADAAALYDILEREVVPTYYDRGLDGVPHNWVAIMKEAIRTVAPAFSMRRMVKDYVNQLYIPALRIGARVDASEYKLARELAQWKGNVRREWAPVTLHVKGPREGQLAIGQPVDVTALVELGTLSPDDVRVELVFGRDVDGRLEHMRVVPMERAAKSEASVYRYTGRLEMEASGSLVYGVRVVPHHPGLAHPRELGLARWA